MRPRIAASGSPVPITNPPHLPPPPETPAMRRLSLAFVAAALGALTQLRSPAADFPDSPRVLSRIAFGSCASQERPQPIWDAVVAQKPDLFVLLGDNIYGDTDNPEVLKAKYAQLAA